MNPPTAAQLAALQVATELDALAAIPRPASLEEGTHRAIRALTQLWTELPTGSFDSWMARQQVLLLEERRVPPAEELARWVAWWRQLAASIAARRAA